MRFRDNRQTLLKGIDKFDPFPSEGDDEEEPIVIVATPRWISPKASGYLAAEMAGGEKDLPQPVPSRRTHRKRKPRQRLAGVALSPGDQPWREHTA